jgi:hypothetical protein
MTPDAPTAAEIRSHLIAGAAQAGFAVGEALEQFRRMSDEDDLDRFHGETVELAADGLQAILRYEIGAIDAILKATPQITGARRLQQDAEDLNQLLGAVTRYLDGWVG